MSTQKRMTENTRTVERRTVKYRTVASLKKQQKAMHSRTECVEIILVNQGKVTLSNGGTRSIVIV